MFPKYENQVIGFAFFISILRKKRNIIPNDSKISHGYFYYEISQCHLEIQECLLNCIFNQQYSSDLLGRKIIDDGNEFYLPNLSYADLQYLIAVESGLDRLYSFWDRITFLLANYDSLGLDFNNLSFDKYFKELSKRVRNGKQTLYDKTSKHLSWLMKFHQNYFKQITNYRHRIVHYKMTPKWEGTLTSRFLNNSMEHGSNPEELKKLKLEFEGLGDLFFEHFNYCKQGFIESLYLIDELK
ncbi:MAG TPA: hypothetical protein VMU83_10605 [Hanamia sp.]|nr:hypothetical protein [Hanamia sp.]